MTGLYEHFLGELLAVIHRDGGHYQHKHGTKRATEGAIAIVYADRQAIAAAEQRGWARAREYAAGLCDEVGPEHNDPFQSQRCAGRIRAMQYEPEAVTK